MTGRKQAAHTQWDPFRVGGVRRHGRSQDGSGRHNTARETLWLPDEEPAGASMVAHLAWHADGPRGGAHFQRLALVGIASSGRGAVGILLTFERCFTPEVLPSFSAAVRCRST